MTTKYCPLQEFRFADKYTKVGVECGEWCMWYVDVEYPVSCGLLSMLAIIGMAISKSKKSSK